MKKIIVCLFLVLSILSVSCIDAFALTKNELKIMGNDIDAIIYSDMFGIDNSELFIEGQTPNVELINDYIISKINRSEKYIINLDKKEEGEFPIYKVPASVFEGILMNSFDVNEDYLVNYRANFNITYDGFGEWYESKYYEENGVYYYTYQIPYGMGIAIDKETMVKGYKELSNGKYEILTYFLNMESTENFSIAGKIKDVDYLVKDNKYYEISGWAKFIVKLSNGYTKFYSYQIAENVCFDGLTIVDRPTYDPKLDFLNGEKQDFNIEGNDLLTFRIDADVNLLEDVYIDTEIVDPKNYTVKSGSTIITFNKEYTKKLKTGEHTLLASYSDGTYAETTFNLNVGNPATFANSFDLIVVVGFFVSLLIIIRRVAKKGF